MSLIDQPARRLSRYFGYGRQICKDLKWHRRYKEPDMPSMMTRVVENAKLLYISGIDGQDYYNHGLYRTDVPFAQKAEYMGVFEQSRAFRQINPARFDILARDKVIFQILASSLELPVPDLLATTGVSADATCGRVLRSTQELAAFLREDDAEHMFLKPGGGAHGIGALSLGAKVSGIEAWYKLPGSELITLDEVVDHICGSGEIERFIIQRRLRPHDLLAEVVPDVCSTLRILTYTNDECSVMGAALRMGDSKGPTDNLTGGGVVVPVDLQSGVLGKVVSIDSGLPVYGECHPVTGVHISGKVIPGWSEILELVKNSSRKLSFMPVIGWDIAVTDNGPIIVEINAHPRFRAVQVALQQGLLVGRFREALLRHDGTNQSGLHLRYGEAGGGLRRCAGVRG